VRRIVAIVLFALGLVAVVLGVGKLTFLSPEATLTASTPAGQAAAPVTLITQEVRNETAGDARVTVHATGDFVAVVGREDDVNAWVADAAVNEISGVDRANHAFALTHRSGVATTPDPRGSDLWISEEEHSGDWQAGWTVPSQGSWTLMLAADGKAAAPIDLSMTWANPDAQPAAKWRAALPWLIGGVVVAAIGALVLVSGPRRRSRRPADIATSPRRAARFAAETGQLPVVTPAVPSAPRGAEDPAGLAPSVIAARTEEPGGLSDETMIHGRLIGEDAAAAPAPEADAWMSGADEGNAGAAEADEAAAETPEHREGASEDADGEDSDGEDSDDGDSEGGDADGGDAEDGNGAGGGTGDATPERERRDERPGTRQRTSAQPQARGGMRRRAVRFGAAVLAVAGLAIPATPAVADETPSGSAAATPAPSGSAAPSGEQALPVLRQVQLDRILKQVSETAVKGDKSRKAADLGSRFGGAALQLRTEYYAALTKGVKYSGTPVPAIAAEPIRAAAVTTTSEWPRVTMVLTQAESSTQPMLLTLVQQDARSNYKTVNAMPMVPGVAFPGVALGAPEVVTQPSGQSGLVATPQEVVDGFGTWVNDAKSDWNDKFESSDFVTALRGVLEASRKANESDKQQAKFRVSFHADASATHALAAPQGGSFVSGYVTATNTIAPQKDGKIDLEGQVQKLTGKKDTDKDVVLTYRMPVFFYVPKEGAGSKIRLVGASFVLGGAALK